jgi:hypothetical protein
MGSSFCQRLAAGLFVARQNHGLHVRHAVLGEEHVLGAAQADAFGAELAGALASRGISALARTPNLPRNSSAQP